MKLTSKHRGTDEFCKRVKKGRVKQQEANKTKKRQRKTKRK